jgi:hypothetical protein
MASELSLISKLEIVLEESERRIHDIVKGDPKDAVRITS